MIAADKPDQIAEPDNAREYKSKLEGTPQVFVHFAIWSHSLSIPKRKVNLLALRRVPAFSSMCCTALWQFLKCFILLLILSPDHQPQAPEHFVNWDPILKQSTPAADFLFVFKLFVNLFSKQLPLQKKKLSFFACPQIPCNGFLQLN